jgi:hypothetical protein
VDNPFLMTADQHRKAAAHLRSQGSPKALEMAYQHEIVAMLIERRLGTLPASPPLSPDP